ncbi:hypothetical protein HanRHA438_Chr01g0033601 [Helianthus annuus]|nr:hypothetical protein HanRHA438_Chr01g0033601 [Helianthus annuus]
MRVVCVDRSDSKNRTNIKHINRQLHIKHIKFEEIDCLRLLDIDYPKRFDYSQIDLTSLFDFRDRVPASILGHSTRFP